MPRFCYAYKIILYQTGPKIKLLLKKKIARHWELCPHTQSTALPLQISGYAPGW